MNDNARLSFIIIPLQAVRITAKLLVKSARRGYAGGMNERFDSPAAHPSAVSAVPVWAMPRAPVDSDVEAAWMAGSALNSLDNLMRSDAPWLGAWRHRLALKAAAAIVQLVGRREAESDLRDAWLLRQPGDDPGPAGNVLAAWRRLAGRSGLPDAETIAAVARLSGLGTAVDSDAVVALVEEGPAAPAPLAAARIADAVVRVEPRAEPLAWWMADLVLARRMRWPFPAPVLATQIHSPLLRFGYERLRARPGGKGFERACLIAAAAGAAEACKLAAGMALQARRLEAAAPKLRAKGAGEVVRLLLKDDAVPGTLTTASLSRWASRRLFDRLLQLEAVRELSGRDSFKIFGL
jgi:hypothetical protein